MKFLNNPSVNVLIKLYNGMNLSEIDAITSSRSQASLITKSLFDYGLIDVIHDTSDRRIKILFLTEKGMLVQLFYIYIKEVMELKDVILC